MRPDRHGGAAAPLPDVAEFRRRWAALHGGVEVSGLVRGWLALSHRLAVPLVRAGVGPDAVTWAGLGFAVAAVPAAAGGRWAAVAALAVLVSAVLDGLDGTVALLSGRAGRRGFVLDSVCDRLAEFALGCALWLAGAPGPLVAGWVALGGLQEYLRARAAVAGVAGIGVVSVAERPTRVVIAILGLLAAAWAPGTGSGTVTAVVAVGVALAAVGLAQVARAIGQGLRRADELGGDPGGQPDQGHPAAGVD